MVKIKWHASVGQSRCLSHSQDTKPAGPYTIGPVACTSIKYQLTLNYK